MLDSLVRVSRRVGGAADLLAAEMRSVPVRHSLYETAPIPASNEARTPGLPPKRKLHPGRSPFEAVRGVKSRRNAAIERADDDATSLRIDNAAAAPTLT